MDTVIQFLLETIQADALRFMQSGWLTVRNLVITSNYATGLAALYLLFYAWRVMFGQARLSEVLPKLFVVVITLGVATGYQFFNGPIYNTLAVEPMHFGEQLAGISAGGGLGSRLDLLMNQGFDGAYSIMAVGGWTDIAPVIFGLLVWLSTLLVVGMCAAYIAIAQFTIAALLVLFPLFVPLAFFQLTRGYLQNYINALITAALIPILTLLVAAFFLSQVESRVTLLVASPDAAAFEIAGYLVTCLILFAMLLTIPSLAAQLGGGAALSTMGVVGAAAGFIANRFNPALKRYASGKGFEGRQRTAARDLAYLTRAFRRKPK
jgi:TrbL/VirB6 plasmid conjugal transfer protein